MSIPTFYISGYGYDNCKEKQYFSKNDYQKQETVPTILGGYLINFFYSLFWLLRNFRDRKNLIEIEGRNSYSSESTDYKERFGGHGRTTGLIVSTNPIQQWSFRKCLTFSWTTLRDKYCRHPIAVMGVVDTFGHCVALDQLGWRRHPDKFNFTSAPQLQPPFSIPQNPAKDHYGALACQKYTVAALKLCGPTSYSSTILLE